MQPFQIEELVFQDSFGVLFRAIDTGTGQTVALRRFFPLGSAGGGLQIDEQASYAVALERLAEISHPALRSIIGGGCDPVDGMPFIATEWVDGSSLWHTIQQSPLAENEAVSLITRALEVSELISGALMEEAVWVDTDLRTIIVGVEAGGRGATFWVSPLKWLGEKRGNDGLESLIGLTENIMGWTGRQITEVEGGGLGRWLEWLRLAARTASLGEAREMLASALGAAPPALINMPLRPSPRTGVLPPKKRPSNLPVATLGVIVLAAMAGGGWALIRWNNSGHPVPPRSASMEDKARSARKSSKKKEQAERPPPKATAKSEDKETPKKPVAIQAPSASGSGQIFSPSDHDLLIARMGENVTLEGTFEGIGYSNSRKTMYLQFSGTKSDRKVRGAITRKDLTGDLVEAKLTPLIGDKIRLRGKVRVERAGDLDRPVVVIEKRSDLEVLE